MKVAYWTALETLYGCEILSCLTDSEIVLKLKLRRYIIAMDIAVLFAL